MTCVYTSNQNPLKIVNTCTTYMHPQTRFFVCGMPPSSSLPALGLFYRFLKFTLTFSRILCKWRHPVHFWSTFTQHNDFEVCPCCIYYSELLLVAEQYFIVMGNCWSIQLLMGVWILLSFEWLQIYSEHSYISLYMALHLLFLLVNN